MSQWVAEEGDICPKCGAKIEVLVGKEDKFGADTEEGIEFPKAERCPKCGWEHELEESTSKDMNLL